MTEQRLICPPEAEPKAGTHPEWMVEFASIAKRFKALRASVERRTVSRDPRTIEVVRADLARAMAAHDPSYIFSDDHSVYTRGEEAFRRLCDLQDELAAMENLQ